MEKSVIYLTTMVLLLKLFSLLSMANLFKQFCTYELCGLNDFASHNGGFPLPHHASAICATNEEEHNIPCNSGIVFNHIWIFIQMLIFYL
jgi:hypothetical protein